MPVSNNILGWFKKKKKNILEPRKIYRLTDSQIQAFQEKHGRTASRILSVLGKTRPFFLAINTDVGQEILKDGLFEMEALLDKIVNQRASDSEYADYRALYLVVTTWSKRIEAHTKLVDQIAKGD